MDRDDLRSILKETGLDLWALIEAAIAIAASDHGAELKLRRDRIVERLYAPPPPPPPQDPCHDVDEFEAVKMRPRAREDEEKGSSSPMEKVFGSSPLTPQSNHRDELDEEDEEEEEEEEEEEVHHLNGIDQEQRRILAIKESLEDPDQSDEAVIGLLQALEDMDITFKALKETDIGRHVNGLRKHPSAEVRRLVKLLVRKWKEIVDEWVKASENSSSAIITDGDSPQQIPAKSNQNGHKVLDFAYSPNTQNGRMSSNSNRSSLETGETKQKTVPKREAPSRPIHSAPSSATPAKFKEEKDNLLIAERLANARKRLHENYQEAQNAKKQRTIQVMDIHEIPKPKNSFMARNRGGQQHQAKHW